MSPTAIHSYKISFKADGAVAEASTIMSAANEEQAIFGFGYMLGEMDAGKTVQIISVNQVKNSDAASDAP